MIGYLSGRVLEIFEGRVIIEANGIGWEVYVGDKGFLIDQELSVFVHTQMKENDISLWGFETAAELKLFKLLISISGVGGKI